MSPILSAQQIAEAFPEMKPYIDEFRDWSPAIYFDTNRLPAAAIGRTEFYNAQQQIAVCNLERINEVTYRFIILGWAWQAVHGLASPTIADTLVIFEECEMELQVDGDNKPSWPNFCVPGGGGINAEFAQTNAAQVQTASNGLGNEYRKFYNPIVIDPMQSFRVLLNSSGVTALGAATDVRISLIGIEARRPN